MRPRRTPALPRSVPRDRLLYLLGKHDRLLASALEKAPMPRWDRKRNLLVVKLEFSIDRYMEKA